MKNLKFLQIAAIVVILLAMPTSTKRAKKKTHPNINFDLAKDLMKNMKLTPAQAAIFNKNVQFPEAKKMPKKSWAST